MPGPVTSRSASHKQNFNLFERCGPSAEAGFLTGRNKVAGDHHRKLATARYVGWVNAKRRFDWIWFAGGALAAATFGGLFGPGAWFAALHKPSWNPPGWVFGPVWTVLYVMIAIAGTLAWRHTSTRRQTTPWWIAQMALNALWTPMFFGLHQLWLAVAVIGGVWVCIVGFIVTVRPQQPGVAALFLPYLAWVSFASALNIAIAAMN